MMKLNRVLSLVLAMVMLLSLVGTAFAADNEETKSAAFTTYTKDGEMIVGDWLWGDVVAQRGAANVMAEYAKAGITDVYLLVKGTGGKVAWKSNVPGAVMSSNGDVLGPTCEAAKPYGIRVHAWMMAGHDTYYLSNIDSSAMAYHFRVGYSDSVIQRINLRDKGYQEYTKALVQEIVANYDVAGIHLDTMRYGALYYDWGMNARDELLTNYGITPAQYNAATKAMCVTGGYRYTTATGSTAGYNNGASYTYYCYSSSGTSPSGSGFATVLGSSSYGDAHIGAKAFMEMRTDTVVNFVKMVGEAAGEDKILSVAIMPEPISSRYETCIYGQDIYKLDECTDYITPMLYATQYAKASSWPAEQSKICANAGCNVVTGEQAFDETYVSYANDLNSEIPLIMAAAEEVNPDNTKGDILGFAYFRGAFMTMGNAVYDKDASKLDVYVTNQKNSYWVSTVNDTKLVFKMQNGMTATSVTGLSGFNSGTKATISSDGKTVTIANGGSTVLPGSKAASFTIHVTGTPSSTHGAVQMVNYTGSSYNENKGFCMTTILGEEPTPSVTEPDATEPEDSTPTVVNDSILIDFNSGDIACNASDWTANHCTIAVDNSQGIAYGTISSSDPYITVNGYPFSRKISAGDVVEVRMKTNITSGTPSTTQVFFATTSVTNYNEAFSIKATAADYTGNTYETLTIPFSSSGSYIGQTMNKIRLDMVNPTSGSSLAGSYEIDYIYVGPAVYAPSALNEDGNGDEETEPTEPSTKDPGMLIDFTADSQLNAVSDWRLSNFTLSIDTSGEGIATATASGSTGRPYLRNTTLTNYVVQEGDIVEIRMKSSVTGGTATNMKLWYKPSTQADLDETYNLVVSEDKLTRGEWQVVNFGSINPALVGKTLDQFQIADGQAVSNPFSSKFEIDYIYFGPAEYAPSYINSCAEGHKDIETWTNNDGTHFGFCYTCGESFTDECIMEEVERAEASETAEGYITFACVGGASGKDHYSVTGGCGHTETEVIPTLPTEPEPTEPEPTEPEPTEPEPTEPEPTEPEPTAPIDPSLKNGIYLEDGLYYYYVNGEIQYAAGLVFVDGAYYYIRSGGYAAIGSYWCTNTNGITQEGFYIFAEDGKMILTDESKTGIYLEDGKYYYYVDGEIQFGAGLVFVDGAYYYIRSGGYAAIGSYWCTNTNGITQEGFYIFGNDGKMLLNDDSKTGIYLEGGLYYYYVEGEIQFGAGLVLVDGAYYYIRSGGYAAIGEYYVSNTNGLLPEGTYTFGPDGKMIQ